MLRKLAIPLLLAGSLVIAPLQPASAHGHHHGPGLGLLGAAVVGAAAIVTAPLIIAGNTLSAPPPVVYAAPPPVYYTAPPAVVYAAPAYYPAPYGYYYRTR